MNNVEKLHRPRTYPTLRIESDASDTVHWMFMHAGLQAGERPCFRPALMADMWAFLSAITLRDSQRLPGRLRHVVLASDSDAFNLGGDLELFSRLIRNADRQNLLDYARKCVEGVHHINNGLGGDVRTIALVQGDALGGGFELALSCQTIVAEEDAGMGLPEVLFGLFPGMGAYSFLCKRVPAKLAEQIILDGRVYSSQELHAMGIVDVLVPRGEGTAAVEELVRRQQRASFAHIALNSVRAVAQPVSYEELMRIAEIWVDTALALGERSLRTMDRIVRAQSRRVEATRIRAGT